MNVSKTELAELLVDADHGSSDRDICIDIVTGGIADLHNTQQNNNWVILVDLYYTGSYDGVDDFTVNDWLEIINARDNFFEEIEGVEISITI